jgi:hypothetical protein
VFAGQPANLLDGSFSPCIFYARRFVFPHIFQEQEDSDQWIFYCVTFSTAIFLCEYPNLANMLICPRSTSDKSFFLPKGYKLNHLKPRKIFLLCESKIFFLKKAKTGIAMTLFMD